MDKLFLTVLNMSLTGAFVIAAVILARLPLKKAPKIISYCLWAVAGFRLVFPFSIESIFSLMPIKPQPIPPDIAMQAIPRIDSGIPFVNNAVSSVLPAATPSASANPLQIWMAIGAYVWLIGAAVMLLYGIVSYALLKRRMRTAIRVEGSIYEIDSIPSPFVLGIIKPKIYLPLSLASGERDYIILHERTHIRRHDHIVKFGAYFILCLHWFNPLAWAAFLLMGVDMEMSCDERVLKEMGGETKHDYSRSLLSLATQRRVIGSSPLAFGEDGVKERVKNVLNFKKPSRVIIVAAVALVAVLSVGFAVNRASNTDPPTEPPTIIVKAGDVDIEWAVGLNKWNGSAYDRLDNFQGLMNGKTIDDLVYVSNGETITIWFEDKNRFPMSPELTEFILSENGNMKYSVDGMLYERFTEVNRNQFLGENYSTSISFDVKPNYATALSSNSGDYLSGNTIKGYRFVCDWDGNECEYAFIVRGDGGFSMGFEQPETTTYEPLKWLDYYNPRDDGSIPYDKTLELELPEFPDTVFTWTAYEVKAIDTSGERVLFGGWPIHNVFLADLNGDGLLELCATVSIGFGLIDTRVIVYDYVNGASYEISNRGVYDYSLSLENGRLTVTQKEYNGGVIALGTLQFLDGAITLTGLTDSGQPIVNPEPSPTSSPHDP